MTRRQFRAAWALQVITWLCFTAIPIVNASSVQTADGWLRLCTGLGVTWVQLDTLETADSMPVEAESSLHCPCVNQILGLPEVWAFPTGSGVAVAARDTRVNSPRTTTFLGYFSRAPPIETVFYSISFSRRTVSVG
ncbi:hypothetical protein [Saccharospirillum impatiens]|uniref:hypothetical protein n=1 Tax=Saccharospirillum impatiens TaxID=169438 RepID=UPI0003FB1AA0|nr:hypothetical protein [Saccharospirillum impatiens]